MLRLRISIISITIITSTTTTSIITIISTAITSITAIRTIIIEFGLCYLYTTLIHLHNRYRFATL